MFDNIKEIVNFFLFYLGKKCTKTTMHIILNIFKDTNGER